MKDRMINSNTLKNVGIRIDKKMDRSNLDRIELIRKF